MKKSRSEASVSRLVRIALAAVAFLGAACEAHADGVGFTPDGSTSIGTVAGGITGGITGVGSGFVMLLPNPTDAVNYQFVETGAYRLTQADGVSALGHQDITLTYSIFGSLNVLNGMASFAGGVVNLYADTQFNFGAVSPGSPVVYGANDGTAIGSFLVGTGGGYASGTVSLQADSVTGSLAPGYFRSASGDDLSGQSLRLTVQIGNAVDLNPSDAVVAEIVCKAAGFPGPGCAGGSYSNGPGWFVVTDHALATISAVPEPATGVLALAGLALVGCITRRRVP